VVCSSQTGGRSVEEQLWWFMHHSYAPGRQTYFLTSYMDDSGSDDLSPVTTIGGPIMSKDAFIDFSPKWSELLHKYRVPQPLHMTDFVRPHGKHIGMHYEIKKSLFRDVSDLINDYKLYSLSVSVLRDDFNEDLPTEVRRLLIGPYGVAFFCVVLGNHGFSQRSLIYAAERIAYLLDVGFPHSDQLYAVHSAIIKALKDAGLPYFIGTMGQSPDDDVPALQAADVIAWAARRRELGQLTDEFATLHWVLRPDRSHEHIAVPKGGIRMFSRPIQNWLSAGKLPSLEELFRVRRA
jgi:Protein of unknown function (DUF3800)